MTEITSKDAVDWNDLTAEFAEGASDIEIAKKLGITAAKFYSLYEQNSAFADFVDAGRTLSQAWWYAQQRKGLWSKNFNTSLYNFVMKNRFGWADKVESADTTGKDNVNVDELRGQVQATMAKLAQTNPELFSGVNLHLNTSKKGENV